jgi:hypothetical protein
MAESAEGARLLSECRGVNLYRGFESLSLRQINKSGLMDVSYQPFFFVQGYACPHPCNLSNLLTLGLGSDQGKWLNEMKKES